MKLEKRTYRRGLAEQDKSLVEQLRKIRQETSINQADMAKMLGVATATLSKIETFKRLAGKLTIIKIKELYPSIQYDTDSIIVNVQKYGDMTEQDIQFADDLIAIRKEAGLTQKELAEDIGVTHSAVLALEEKIRRGGINILQSLIRKFPDLKYDFSHRKYANPSTLATIEKRNRCKKQRDEKERKELAKMQDRIAKEKMRKEDLIFKSTQDAIKMRNKMPPVGVMRWVQPKDKKGFWTSNPNKYN